MDLQVGTPCSICFGSIVRPAEIIEVKSPKFIIVREMTKDFKSNPNGERHGFSLRKHGFWILRGTDVRNGPSLDIGSASYF